MGKKKKGNKAPKKAESKSKYSVSDLLEKVNEYIDNFEFDLAEKFCDRALSVEPTHAGALELAGSIKAEQGDLEGARNYLEKAIEVLPDEGHSKYMYLGQISGGKPAAECYLKGIELMRRLHEQQSANAASSSDGPAISELEISNAYCSLAEIYLTDSCFDDNAETLCQSYCDEALKYGPRNPDAHLVMCNYLISKERQEEGKALLLNNFSIWNVRDIGDADDSVVDTGEDDDTVAARPPYASRAGLVKLLLELSEPNKAEAVLASLLQENDEDIEVWYFLAIANQMKEDLVNMKICLLQVQTLYAKLGMDCDDDEIFSHVVELLKSCEGIDVDEIADIAEDDGVDSGDAEMEES